MCRAAELKSRREDNVQARASRHKNPPPSLGVCSRPALPFPVLPARETHPSSLGQPSLFSNNSSRNRSASLLDRRTANERNLSTRFDWLTPAPSHPPGLGRINFCRIDLGEGRLFSREHPRDDAETSLFFPSSYSRLVSEYSRMSLVMSSRRADINTNKRKKGFGMIMTRLAEARRAKRITALRPALAARVKFRLVEILILSMTYCTCASDSSSSSAR